MARETFFVTSFGCRASQSEGAAIIEELAEAGAREQESPYEADVVVLNTCTVTEEADREARQWIRRIASRNPKARVIVTGCYAQRAPEEIAAFPNVSHVVGNSHKAMVPDLVLSGLETPAVAAEGRAEIFCSSIFTADDMNTAAHFGSAGRTRAVVKVQDGCNATCTFCIIPAVRGRSRSMAADRVIAEVEQLVERGYKEVVLSGIHLGTYGRDFESKQSLAALVQRILQAVPSLERLRLSSIEPQEVTGEITALVAAESRLARHFHIPLQSGSRRILREMKRPYTPEFYRGVVERARASVPDAAIGADVMVGFPGETDDEFSETLRLIEDSPLTYVHVFPFSARPGTPAASLQSRVPSHVADFRARRIREAIALKNEAFRRGLIGGIADVLILQPEDGLSSNFVRVRAPKELESNRWKRLRITGLDGAGVSASTADPL